LVLAQAGGGQTPSPAGAGKRKSKWCPDHEGDASWTVDLLWEVFHEKQANHRIYEILAGEERGRVPWDMSRHDEHCGVAVEKTFRGYFASYEISYYPYYVDIPKSMSRKDLRFDRNKVKNGVKKIKELLDKGVPVRVPLIHGVKFTIEYKKIKPHHYVGIVGYKGDTFLYMDPAVMAAYSWVPGYADRAVSIHVGTLIYDQKKGLLRGGQGKIAPRAHVLGGPL
jgi:hypothetical protein